MQNGEGKNKLQKLLDILISYGIEGTGPFVGAEELANGYILDKGYKNDEERVSSLIRREVTKSFGSGFASGIGSSMSLPVSVPTSIITSMTGQARLAGAIAIIYGHSLESRKVKTMIMLAMAGDGFREILKKSGINLANRLASTAVKGLSGTVMNEISRRAGLKIISRITGNSSINLAKAVPIAGGLAGGIIDAVTCASTGRTAKRIFRRSESSMGENIVLNIPFSRISDFITLRIKQIKSVELKEDSLFSISVKYLPLKINLKFINFNEGMISLLVTGNKIKKRIVTGWLRNYLGKSRKEIRENIHAAGDSIEIRLNSLTGDLMNELPGIKISSLRISGGNIIAEIN